LWEKAAKRLTERRLMLDPVAIANDDDGRNRNALQAGTDIFDHINRERREVVSREKAAAISGPSSGPGRRG
jgi:hypothetical protein